MRNYKGNEMSEIKKGSRVDVDFISESRTEFSGNRFTGRGTVDLFEDGYVIGRLDDGRCFACGEADVTLVAHESGWFVSALLLLLITSPIWLMWF